MPGLFEELKDLADLLPADQSVELRKLIENPANEKFAKELKEGRLRQSDYSRYMNENKAALDHAEKMKVWAADAMPKHKQTLKDFADLETTNKTLEQEANDLRDKLTKVAAGDLNVDEATLDARVDARVRSLGYVNKSELDTIIKQEGAKLAREEAVTAVNERTDAFLTQTWPAATEIMSALVECSFSHLDEFKKPLSREDRVAIGNLMKTRGIEDPLKAYDEWVAPKRNDLKMEAEVERRVAEKMSNNNGFPGVSGIPMNELGPMQAKAAGTLPDLPDGIIGDGGAAAAAAKEFRSEGKF